MYVEPQERYGIKTWYYDFTINKKRYRGWLGPAATTKRSQAKAAVKKIQAEIITGAYEGLDRKKQLTPKEVLDYYSEYLKTHRPRTHLTYKYTHKSIMGYFGKKQRITDADIVAYQKMRIKQGRAGATVNRDPNYCNAAYNRALKKKLIKENPFTGFDKFREEPRTRYLSEAELAGLLAHCDAIMRDVVLTAILTGLRKRPILNLHADQVDFAQGTIHIPGAMMKNRKALSVPMPDELAKIMRKRIDASGSGYVFENPNTGKPFVDMKKSWRRAIDAAQLKDFRFHDLRHTFATYALLNCRDLRTVQELLGHKDMRMTQRYTHVLDRQKRDVASQLGSFVNGIVEGSGNTT